ncbi:hypothetical protein GCM10020220_094340 [Nonomuraea rubra]|uniref:LOG family protein n=1 Tax=Nonomuraea rubra TaxID=46180 RepID=UPI0031E56814
MLGIHDRPLVLLDPWGLYGPLKKLVEGMYDEGFTRPDVFDAISWASTVDEAFAALESRAQPVRPASPSSARPPADLGGSRSPRRYARNARLAAERKMWATV